MMSAKPILVSSALLLGLLLSACGDREGPFERTGRAIDESLNDARRALEDAAD